MQRSHRASFILLASALFGCAATPTHTETPKSRQVVIDEPTVVTATSPVAPHAKKLPEMPVSLQPVSPSLQCGYELVETMLEGDGEAPLPQVCASLSSEYFSLPKQYRMVGAAKLLVEVLERDDKERDVGRALLAFMIEMPLEKIGALVRTKEQCAQHPDPTACETESRVMLMQVAGSVHAAFYALQSCADSSTRDPSFETWRTLCGTHLASVKQRVEDNPDLAKTLEEFRAKARIAAAGPRPVGPANCWSPSLPSFEPAPIGSTCVAPPEGLIAAPWTKAPSMTEEYAGPWPRDHLFGPQDPSNHVRVSLSLEQMSQKPGLDASQLDARAVASTEMHRLLGQCLADEPADAAVTLAALTADLSFDAHGKIRSAKVKKLEDAAAPEPSKKLLLCVQQTLMKAQTLCAIPAKPSVLRARICLGKEIDEAPAGAAMPSTPTAAP